MSKTKSISDLAIELQSENEKLQTIQKQYIRLVNQVCKDEFGMDSKAIHDVIEKQRIYELQRAEKQRLQSGQKNIDNDASMNAYHT